MNRIDTIRAWKDEDYRSTLTEAQRAGLPGNPAGLVEVSITVLENAAGGKPRISSTAICATLPRGCPGSCARPCRPTLPGATCRPKTIA